MADPVLLFHGLGRGSASMRPMARALARSGYATHVVGYPSTRHPIGALVERFVAPEVDRLLDGGAERIHFVTHSLGGILVRALAAARFDAGRPLPDGSRAVFLAPPNGGSPVAEALGETAAVRFWPGPALGDLGLGPASVPRGLGPVRGVEAGVIAGTRRIVPSGRFFHGSHDGLVSVASAFDVAGLADTAVVARSHALLMRAPDVIALTLAFLATGRFRADAA